jgi:hypothetical protein
MNIESLAPDLLWQLQRIGEDFTAWAKYPGGFDINVFASNWRTLIAANLGKIFVIRDPATKEISGCLGCVFVPDPFNGQMTAMEQFWFVHPKARGRDAILLLNSFESEASARHCKRIVMVHLAGEGASSLETLYNRRGYSVVEQSYAKEI